MPHNKSFLPQYPRLDMSSQQHTVNDPQHRSMFTTNPDGMLSLAELEKFKIELEERNRREQQQEIMALLASQPTPQEILAICPSEALQQRVRGLLAKRKRESLSIQEETELERHLTVEHLVRLAKTNAYAQLKKAS